MEILTWIVALVGIGSIPALFFGTYIARRKPSWDENARKLRFDVYEPLLTGIKGSRKSVESCEAECLSLAPLKLNCLLGKEEKKKEISSLKELRGRYKDALSLAEDEMEEIIKENAKEGFSAIQDKLENDESFKISTEDRDVSNLFTNPSYVG